MVMPRAGSSSAIRPGAVGGESRRRCRPVRHRWARFQAPMIPFEMVVRDKLVHGSPKMALAQRDDPIEAFFFDWSNESLGVRVGVDYQVHRRRAVRPKPFVSRIPSIRCMAASSH